KENEAGYLEGLGAKEVMSRKNLDLSKIKPLDKASWAGAVDNLGGEVLAWMASTMMPGGTIASIGLAASMNLNTSVAPFILRGLDGFALLERIRQSEDPRIRSMPVIVISGDEDDATKKRARAAGANDFITKTTDGTEILSRIDNLLHLVEAKQQLVVNKQALE